MPYAAAAELAERLRAIADPARLRILSVVLSHADGTACVCEISDAVGTSAPALGRHLAALREAGLLQSEVRGPWSVHRATEDGRQLYARVQGCRPQEAPAAR
ncbi:metalloregulator ArsR/SmtB family transcription factor [Nonomuraea sp. NPDC050404]|uniref:ArsR/SmtB family transcription factor n=1 Tax=Nonomuraea sp. NPDC050404 TaxID=3155783 RepID=UPI0033C1C1EE